MSTTSLKSGAIAWFRIILPNLCCSVNALESRYLSYDSSQAIGYADNTRGLLQFALSFHKLHLNVSYSCSTKLWWRGEQCRCMKRLRSFLLTQFVLPVDAKKAVSWKKVVFVVPRQYAASFLHFLYRLQEKWKVDLYLYTCEDSICPNLFSKSMAKQSITLLF